MDKSDLLGQCIDVLGSQPHEIRENESCHEININLPDLPECNRKMLIESRRNLVIIYSQCKSIRAQTDEQKKNCLRFISKANEGISFGNVELNYDSGEFRYKTSQAFPGVRDARPVIAFMLEQQNINFQRLVEVLPRMLTGEIDFANAAQHVTNLQ
ncbi:unnamed protein product [Blepharisma stoltei]|uniref:Uncharacterized protein n=1 Tax=Blepharisma stoltei TaxID=1481888 RepID=A0AAU9JU50_9CILI|nr:unnamed protein product [Blepharisma stoltei]